MKYLLPILIIAVGVIIMLIGIGLIIEILSPHQGTLHVIIEESE